MVGLALFAAIQLALALFAAIQLALPLFAAIQLALPLRHYAYAGNVRWTEEGYLFAWWVMLTEKVGFVRYRVHDPDSGRSWLVEPDEYLTPLQVERMAFQPELIRQTADFIAEDFADRGHANVTVRRRFRGTQRKTQYPAD